MRFNTFVLTGLTALACLGMGSKALANGRNPGSLLIFPEFDNRVSDLTLLTVTNTNSGVNPDGSNGTVRVEFVYIGRVGLNHQDLDCLEFNRTEILTANDTFTAITSAHNPNQEQGFFYVFAKDLKSGRAITFNWLIGNLMSIRGIEQLEYSMNPVAFKGLTAAGTATDVDGDHIRDLSGLSGSPLTTEYEAVPNEILIPRFLATGGSYASEMLLIALSGGSAFQTIANFWIYNDNEEAFSAQYQFHCWARVPLSQINGAFSDQFLKSTNHNPLEIVGLPASAHESGWIRVYGDVAYSTQEQINDPAMYAVLIERVGTFAAADLPFESNETQGNGALFPHSIFGDGDPTPVNGDNQ